MITFLKVFFALTLLFMIYVVVGTSYQSNLFDLIRTWDPSNNMAPWFSATLWDFYANVAFISVWVAYKEKTIPRTLFWLVLLVCLGSIATAAYVLIQLFKLSEGEGLDAVFLSRKG